ncbi:MAG TPA: hypothetical protein VF212_16065 [Longimicrobiales bacterium]
MRVGRMTLLMCFVLVGPGALAAQEVPAWDSPTFLPPRPGDDLGVYLVDPSGGDWALAGIWRQSGNLNLGVRLGVADAPDETPVFFGAEFYGPLVRADRDFPLDVAWLLGAGATLDGGTFLRIPAGVSVGRAVDADGLVFVPYAVPRVGFDILADDGDSETEFSFTIDLGVDLEVDESLLLRFGAALGDHDAIGAGVAWRLGRRVTAR